jgi:hypothetical protein
VIKRYTPSHKNNPNYTYPEDGRSKVLHIAYTYSQIYTKAYPRTLETT